jgi:hypothetical protein
LLPSYVKLVAQPTQEVVLVSVTTSLDIRHSRFSPERIDEAANHFVFLPNAQLVAQNTLEVVLIPMSACDEVRHYGSLSVRSLDAGGSIAQLSPIVCSSLGVSQVWYVSSKVVQSADVGGPRPVFEFGEPSSTFLVPDSGVKLGSKSNLVLYLVVLLRLMA